MTAFGALDRSRKNGRAARFGFFLLVLVFLAVGVSAVRSPLFAIRLIEVRDLPEGAPFDSDSLIARSGIELGRENIYAISLARIERKLLEEPWLRSVRIERQPPQSLVFAVELRRPVAIYQSEQGLRWLDQDGKIFGELDVSSENSPYLAQDLPTISGDLAIPDTQGATAWGEELASFLATWNQKFVAPRGVGFEIASFSHSKARGWRAWVTFRASARSSLAGTISRVSIDLGSSLKSGVPGGIETSRLDRIGSVLNHIKNNGIPARHLFADGDKKIVVKLTAGS